MRRRDFIAAGGAALFARLTPRLAAATSFPVHYRKASPYESLARYLVAGNDDYKDEAAALALEERLRRMFRNQEKLPQRLAAWTAKLPAVRSARFYALPNDLVRYEIALSDAKGLQYTTGLWKAPDFESVAEETVSAPRKLFADVTAHVFGGVPSFNEQLLRGNPWWRARLDS